MAGESFIEFDSKQLSAFGRVLKTADLPAWKATNKALRKIITPIAGEVKAAALALPSSNKGKRQGAGLRQGIAAAVKVQMSSTNKRGAFGKIRISGTTFMKASGIHNPRLPRYMEGLSKKPWRHPVWADKGSSGGKWAGTWAVQQSHPFFVPVGIAHKAEVRDKMAQTFLDEVQSQINKGTKLH